MYAHTHIHRHTRIHIQRKNWVSTICAAHLTTYQRKSARSGRTDGEKNIFSGEEAMSRRKDGLKKTSFDMSLVFRLCIILLSSALPTSRSVSTLHTRERRSCERKKITKKARRGSLTCAVMSCHLQLYRHGPKLQRIRRTSPLNEICL